MQAELKVLIFVAATLGFAYVAVYPRLSRKTIGRMLLIDAGLTVFMLICVGSAYGGISLRLPGVDVPWWVFTLVAATVIEAPLFWWFCKRWDIDPRGPHDGS